MVRKKGKQKNVLPRARICPKKANLHPKRELSPAPIGATGSDLIPRSREEVRVWVELGGFWVLPLGFGGGRGVLGGLFPAFPQMLCWEAAWKTPPFPPLKRSWK